MCSLIHVCSVDILNNPAKLDVPYKLEITFEAFEFIQDGVSWELVFVNSDGDEKNDQVLDDVVIANVKEGRHKFTLECDGPKIESLRVEDLTDVTLLLLKCKYRDEMFMKVGWFVTHAYEDPELVENPPEQPIPEKMLRTISVDDCRVTHYPIKWSDTPEDVETAAADGEMSEPASSQTDVQMDSESVASQTSALNEEVDSLKLKDGAGDGSNETAENPTPDESTKAKISECNSRNTTPFADVTNN